MPPGRAPASIGVRTEGARRLVVTAPVSGGQDLFEQDVRVAAMLRELAQDLEVQCPHGPLAASDDGLVAP